jgi:hypothetical protein
MSPLVLLGVIRARELRARIAGSEVAAPSAKPIAPYEVRIRRSLGGTLFVVGHDRHGEPMVEVRVRQKHVSPSMVQRMERWCRDHDKESSLALV